jgi:hypothetical protein
VRKKINEKDGDNDNEIIKNKINITIKITIKVIIKIRQILQTREMTDTQEYIRRCHGNPAKGLSAL